MCTCCPDCRREEITNKLRKLQPAGFVFDTGNPKLIDDVHVWLYKHDVDKSEDSRYMLAYTNDEGKRYKIKTGKFVKKFFGAEKTDKEIQDVSSEINSLFWLDSAKVEILRGEDLREKYLSSNSGIRSCMAYSDTQNFLDIYVDNPEVVGLAYINDGNHAARALIWTIDGVTYMDRMYSTSDTCRQALIDFANEKVFLDRGDMYASRLSVKMKIRNGLDSYWPYIDTMDHVTIIDNKIAELSSYSGDYRAQYTDGTLTGDYITCDWCDARILEEDAFWLESEAATICQHCWRNEVTQCDCCHTDVSNDHIIEVDGKSICESCIEQSYTICQDCKEYVHLDNIHTDADGFNICPSCWENYSECAECGNYYSHDKMEDDCCKECAKLNKDVENE